MLNTKYLGKAVGIQYQGVQDNSVLRAGQGGAVGVIVGQFKRGSLNKAFPVTIENYRARLGYDPTNPHYVAVQDLFALGYPLVWIQRLGDSNSVVVPPVGQMSCEGAINWFGLGFGRGVNWESPTVPLTSARYAINGVSYIADEFGGSIPIGYFGEYTLPDDYPTPAVEGSALRNITNSNLRFEFQLLPENQDQFSLLFFGDSPTIVELGNNHWGVCLSPAEQELPQISCDGATSNVTLRLFGTWSFRIDGGEPIEVTISNLIDGGIALTAALSGYGLAAENVYDSPTEINYLMFSNTSDENLRIELIQVGSNGSGQCLLNYVQNPTFAVIEGSSVPIDDNRLNFSSAAVCLAPDECSSTAITFEIFQSWNGMNESGYEKSIKLYDATTNELLGIGEAPIEENDGDYSNILPDFIENLNAGDHQITATPYINDYGYFWGVKLVSATHREFRLEVFIGNEGGVSVVPSPDTTMNDVNIDDSAASEHGAVLVNFCLLPELIQYVLTIDDKGLVPSDGIYSGTITPPLPSASLSFNIQHYSPSGGNGRIFNVYRDAEGLVVSPNGEKWEVDRANLASWFDDFPTASDFTETGTYQFTIHKMIGDENIVFGELTYIV